MSSHTLVMQIRISHMTHGFDLFEINRSVHHNRHCKVSSVVIKKNKSQKIQQNTWKFISMNAKAINLSMIMMLEREQGHSHSS